MAAAVTITPVSGSVIDKITVCKIVVSGLTSNDATAYDITKTPTEPELRYYCKVAKSGMDDLKSVVFAVSADGLWEWDDLIIPASGTWTITCNKTSNDAVVATASVVVS